MRTMNKCVLLPRLDVIKVLWDLDPNKGALKMIEGKMGDAVHYASFCPTSEDRVCVSGNGQLSMWVYERSFTVWHPIHSLNHLLKYMAQLSQKSLHVLNIVVKQITSLYFCTRVVVLRY